MKSTNDGTDTISDSVITYYDPNSRYYVFTLWYYHVAQPIQLVQPISLSIQPVLYGPGAFQESESCKAKEVMEERSSQKWLLVGASQNWCSTMVNLCWVVEHVIIVFYSSTNQVFCA